MEFIPHAEIVEDKVLYSITQVKVTFSYDYESVEEKVRLDIDLSKTKDNQLCLNFTKVEGNPLYYKMLVVAIKNEFAYAVKQE